MSEENTAEETTTTGTSTVVTNPPAPSKPEETPEAPKGEETKPAEGQGRETVLDPPAPKKDEPEGETKPEPKAEETKPDESKPKGEETPKGPPEKYDLKLPDDSKLDEGFLERSASQFRERGLTNEEAQAEVERHSQTVSEVLNAQQQALDTQVQKWGESLREKYGDTFEADMEHARRFLEKFDTSGDLRKNLKATGYGNYPPAVDVFVAAGRAMAEDSFVKGSPSGATKTIPTAELLGKVDAPDESPAESGF